MWKIIYDALFVEMEKLKMAIQLIDQLSGPFDISKYKDTYSEELMKLIGGCIVKSSVDQVVTWAIHKNSSSETRHCRMAMLIWHIKLLPIYIRYKIRHVE